ncbi:hemolysin-III related-domain-containing protein [Neohortaea acidophila]|uniref:Hemolysin-III related-domain-containing protein n=1 Tax=Neohortaea acidophila TaxID=245834 RepID=A0A6A6PL35_9PEZI|nr:hemolysin-III related-domain-containing protein [Neohortaea acidophila]KAF2480374.1 hemolysin-III related-domain-containing protein [Neohortaea acidophila]
MLQWHDETVNIHTHTFGCALFAVFPLHFYTRLYSKVDGAQPIDKTMFFVYFFGVAVCFACSSSFHVISNLNPRVSKIANRLDYCGIVILMWSASIASIHFAFVCHPTLRSMHWFLVSASASGCIAFTLYPEFIGSRFRAYRTLMYSSLGLFGLVFMLHGIYLDGFAIQRERLALRWMILMAALNFIGAAFYATTFPECRYPYRSDFLGASHQLLHTFVVLAGIAHYKGLTDAFLAIRTKPLVC